MGGYRLGVIMDKSKKLILLIDDDKFIHKLVKSSLANYYDILIAETGDQGIQIAREQQPKAILLDIEMPGKNGYETCEALKSDEQTRKIPVIFLSSKDGLREKMQGFEMGADDYLLKPFEKEILRVKLSLAIHNYLSYQELDQQIASAQSVAFEALTNSAELGRALRFVEHTYAIDSFDGLANGLFKAMEDFGLKTSVCFFPLVENEEPLFYSYNGQQISVLERDLLVQMHPQGRIIDFGQRTFINFRNVSLLIKNMPLDDMTKYGRIKDATPFILGAVDGKIRNLYMHQMMTAQSAGLAEAVQLASDTLTGIDHQLTRSQEQTREVVGDLMFNLDQHLSVLGLNESQERYVVELIEGAFQDVLNQLGRNVDAGKQLNTLVLRLKSLSDQQAMMAERSRIELEQENAFPNDGAIYSNDVELF